MAQDNLTREEARARRELLSVMSYDLALDLTADEELFVSDTTVRFTSIHVGLPTWVDLEAVRVREITFNGRSVDPSSYDPSRSRLPLRGLLANNELRVVAECAYQHAGIGLHRFVDPTDGKVYLHTQFEPFDAHRVFACFDQPDLKGSFRLTVRAPEDWTVVSNMAPADREGDTWSFSPTPPISTYLVAVVAGPYHRVHDTHGDVELGLYCRESLAQFLDTEEILTVTRQGLDFFAAEFAYPLPFEKYEQLFVPEFNFGAMENPGCITFSERYLFRSRMTHTSFERRATTILHEMAHMWFGDLVTMRWWDDLWLNESFATYMATHALARATRFSDSWVRFAWDTKAAAVAQDQLPTTHPISTDVVDTDAVRLHLDSITYDKGASVLKQLAAWVGEEQFTEGLRAYFVEHEWDNAELADFLAALEATSGRDLGSWSKEWLETAGVVTLRADAEVVDGRYGSVSIVQEAPPEHPTVRSHRLAVGLYDRSGPRLTRRRRVELDVVGPRTEVAELAGEAVADLLLVNDDDLTYAKVRLDRRSLATLDGHLSAVEGGLARNLCWAATWDMVRDAELPTRRYVALVTTHAPLEPDDTTLQQLLAQARVAVDAYGDPSHRLPARSALTAAAAAGLESAPPGSDRQLAWARYRVATADSGDDLALLRALLDGTEEVPGLAVDTDLRWQIVSALAAHGVDDDGRLVDEELARDPTDIGQRHAAAARASHPSASAKAQAWEELFRPGLHLAMLRAIAGGFVQYGQEELLRPYLEPYLASLHPLWDERPREESLELISALFPHPLVDEDSAARVDAALADATLPGPVRRVLLEGNDRLRRSLRARAADRDPGEG